MALPEEYLKLDTEQQRAALVKAIGAHKRAGPGNRHQAARDALIVSTQTETDSLIFASKPRVSLFRERGP
jgi:hypothetical protein